MGKLYLLPYTFFHEMAHFMADHEPQFAVIYHIQKAAIYASR
jgi:hypothetical protein